jgi:hypothetical protein
MASLLSRWSSRPRVKYKPLDNSVLESIEMADRSVAPITAHEEGRDVVDSKQWSQDVAGGDLNQDAVKRPADDGLPQYKGGREDSTSTLGNGDRSDDITEEELATLRRVPDKIPMSAWFVVIVELCERFTFYGLSPPFQNYIQFSQSDTPPGWLGLGQQGATGLTNL